MCKAETPGEAEVVVCPQSHHTIRRARELDLRTENVDQAPPPRDVHPENPPDPAG
jgi:hypothetical protein